MSHVVASIHTRTRIVVFAALLGAALFLGAFLNGNVAQAVDATFTCDFETDAPATLTVTATSGGDLKFGIANTGAGTDDEIRVNGVSPCTDGDGGGAGTKPLRDNTDKIIVTGDANDQVLIIDLSPGLGFAPGATADGDGNSEIEWEIDLLGGSDTWRYDSNAAVPNSFSLGDSTLVGFDVGANADIGTDTDEDQSIRNTETFVLNGSPNIDTFKGDGGAIAGSAPVPSGFRLQLNGLAGADILTGGNGNDVLTGGAADDALTGGAGNDAYLFPDNGAGAETDTVNEGASEGTDTLDFTGTTAVISADLGANAPMVFVTGGRDVNANAENNFEEIITGSGDDSITDNEAVANKMTGADGSDTYIFQNPAAAQADEVVEGATADLDHLNFSGTTTAVNMDFTTAPGSATQGARTVTITGSAEFETATGGDGNDTIIGHNPGMTLNGGPGNDELIGGGGGDILNGGAGDDFLKGEGGADQLNGGDDTDILRGGAGADANDGGDGGTEGVNVVHPLAGITTIGDALDYQTSAASVTINLETGAASGGDAAGDTIATPTIESVYGSGAATTPGDNLTGDSQQNRLVGGAGDDTMNGRTGDDFEVGGAGDDTYNQEAASNGGDTMIEVAAEGTDTVNYCARANPVTVSKDGVANDGEAGENDNVDPDIENVCAPTAGINLTGTAGDDVLVGSAGNDNIDGLGGNDQIFGRAGNDNLDGGDGDDYLYGEGGTDTLDGGEGSDELEGGGNDDHMDGGADLAGDDTDELTYKNSPGLVMVNLGDGTATGDDATGDTFTGIEDLTGSQVDASGDTLIGDNNNNTLNGMGGDDVLNGKEGDDILVGGDDDDTFKFDMDVTGGGETDTVDERAGGGNDTIDLSAITDTGFANLWVGSSVQMAGHPQGSPNRSINTAAAPVSGAHFENAKGGSAFDALQGNAADNVLEGNGGNDLLDGNEGDDTLKGGPGTNTVDYQFQADGVTPTADGIEANLVEPEGTVDEGASVDIVSDAAIIVGTAENDILRGGPSVNVLVGLGGNDILEGRGSGDVLKPGAGADDTVSYESSPVGVTVDLDANTLSGGHAENDQLCSDDAASTVCVLSSTTTESVTGSEHDDDLTGDGGTNTLKGLGGNDELTGLGPTGLAPGDTLDGGDGTDRANYDDGAEAAGVVANLTTGLGGGAGSNALGDTYVGIENLDGTDAFNDVLTGNGQANVLRGHGGADTLEGRGGPDVIDGGEGGDTASYKNSSAIVNVDLLNDSANGGDAEGDDLNDIENLIGADVLGSGDTLVGDDGPNVLSGGIGDDRLVGLNGNDTLNGGLHNDMLEGGQGADIENGDEDNDVFKQDNVANGDDTLTGGSGVDEVTYEERGPAVEIDLFAGVGGEGAETDTYAGIENATGGNGGDLIGGDAAPNVLTGGPGDDTIVGSAGDDNLIGGEGDDDLSGDTDNDVVEGGPGNDTLREGAAVNGGDDLHGGTGRDRITYAARAGDVTVNLNGLPDDGEAGENDHVMADVEDISGGAGNDLLIGSSAANDIDGNAGDDEIQGLGGADDLDGGTNGAGGDTVSYSGSPGLVTVDLTAGTASGPGSDADGDTIAGFENAIGANQNSPGDTLLGDGGPNTLMGLGGDDTLRGLAGDDSLFGGDGDDTLEGGADSGGADVELIDGGNGNDVSDYSSSPTFVDIDLQADTVAGGAGSHALGDELNNIEDLNGSGFDDFLRGDQGNNRLRGMEGDDFLKGRGGDDDLQGGLGTDTIDYADDAFIDESAIEADLGAGTVEGASTDSTSGVENINGSDEGDILTGNQKINVINAGDGDDTLAGLAQGDTLACNGGANDVLDYSASPQAVNVTLPNGPASGGHAEGDTISDCEGVIGSSMGDTIGGTPGDDSIVGGAGNDTFLCSLGADTIDADGGVDTFDCSADTAGFGLNLITGVGSGPSLLVAGDMLTNFENVIGGSGNDTLIGNQQDNELYGNEGDDSLEGRGGSDYLDGGEGGETNGDTSDYSNSPEQVQVNMTTGDSAGGDGDGDFILDFENITGSNWLGSGDLIVGDGAANTLNGLGGNDQIYGLGGNDSLTGGFGNDLLDGGAGDDHAAGNQGNDSYVFGPATAATEDDEVEELLGEGSDTLDLSTLPGDEPANVDLTDDTDIANHSDGANNRQVVVDTAAGGAADHFENVKGGAAGDEILGNDAPNVLEGNDSTDHIEGGLGSDTLLGGPGAENATLIGGPGDDILDGGLGNDVFAEGSDVDGAGADTFIGGDGIDRISYLGRTGTGVVVNPNGLSDDGQPLEGDNVGADIENIDGSHLADILIGTSARNVINGFFGDDTIAGLGPTSGPGDTLDGGGSGLNVDTVDYSASPGVVNVDLTTGAASGGDAEGDILSSFFNVTGSNVTASGDVLTGNILDNVIRGLGGDDRLTPMEGHDTLDGGSGDDIYLFGDAIDGDFVLGGAQDETDTLIEGPAPTGGSDTLDFSAVTLTVTADLTLNSPADMAFHTFGAGTRSVESETSANFENVIGGSSDDLLQGNAAGNHLVGNGSTDTLVGRGGDDHLEGNAGNDLLEGNNGNDVLNGGDNTPAGDTITYVNDNDAIIANLANGTVQSTSTDSVDNVENVIGTNRDDKITGDQRMNQLVGLGGNDRLTGLGEADTLYPGTGNDTLDYGASPSAVDIDLAANTLSGGDAEGDELCEDVAVPPVPPSCGTPGGGTTENLVGSAHNDVLRGNTLTNRLEGNDGDDLLEGRDGGDTLIGGSNNSNGPNSGDTANYADSPAGVSVDLNSGDASGGHAAGDNLSAIENVEGSASADTLRGNEERNRLRGNGGDDWVEGRGGPDVLDGGTNGGSGDTADYKNSATVVQVNLLENAGNMGDAQGDSYAGIENVQGSNVTGSGDIIIGDDNPNGLIGLGGDDALFGMGAGDSLTGGFGNDILDGGEGSDSTTGNQGNDTYSFASAIVAESDTVTETTGSNSGTDHLDFSQLLTGEPLTLDMSSGAAQAVHTNRTLTIVGPLFVENASGGAGSDTITGTSEKNEIWGNGNPDTLTAGDGDDIVHGGTGNDTALDGGLGDDTLYGDSGNDVFSSPAFDDADTYSGGVGRDQISYFGRPSGVTVILNGLADDGEVALSESDHVLADIENIRGTDSNDILIGSNTELGTSTVAANTILGEGGDDRIAGLAGADVLVGGANGSGGDTLDYQDSPSAVTVTLPAGPAAGGHAELDTLSGFENLWGSNVVGGSTADVLIGDAGPNQLKGFNGNDVLVGNDGDDDLQGGNHNDIYAFGATVDPQSDHITELTDGGTDTLSFDDSVSGPVAASVTVDLTADAPTATQGGGPRTVDVNDANNLENVVGGDGDDVLYGNNAVNVIKGGEGDDDISGRGGNDDLDGGFDDEGGDTINYLVDQSEGVKVNLGPEPSDYGTGVGITTNSTDSLHGFENIEGSNLADELRGTNGDNDIDGNGGNDIIAGRADSGDTDDLDGGGGINTVDYSELPAPAGDGSGVDVSLLAGTASEAGGSYGFDNLDNFRNVIGSDFNDDITGDGVNNSLSGGDGDDVIEPLQGNDQVDGGDHDITGDEIDLSATAGGGVNVDLRLTAGTVTGIGGSDAGIDDANRVENVRATNFADVIYGSDVANRIWGLNGNDGINPMRGDDFTFAGGGDDDLFAMADYDGKDDWHGESGIDRMTYKDRHSPLNVSLDDEFNDGFVNSEGDNVHSDIEDLDGGQSHDKLSGSDVKNVIRGESGNDQIYGRRGNDYLLGMVGNDGIRGEHGNDSLFGEDGSDGLIGGVGNDREFGGRNNDVFYQERVSNGRDDISGGLGVDRVDYRLRVRRVVVFLDGKFNDGEDANGNNLAEEKDRVRTDIEIVVGGRSNDRLVGDGRRNWLYGMQGHDVLSGGGGHDLLYGHTGHDNLVGGTGRDRLYGQSGNDNFFACDNDRDLLNGGSGSDDAERDKGKDRLSSIEGTVINC